VTLVAESCLPLAARGLTSGPPANHEIEHAL